MPTIPPLFRCGGRNNMESWTAQEVKDKIATLSRAQIGLLEPHQLRKLEVADLAKLDAQQLDAIFAVADKDVLHKFTTPILAKVGDHTVRERFEELRPHQRLAIFQTRRQLCPRRADGSTPLPLTPAEIPAHTLAFTADALKAMDWSQWAAIPAEKAKALADRLGGPALGELGAWSPDAALFMQAGLHKAGKLAAHIEQIGEGFAAAVKGWIRP